MHDLFKVKSLPEKVIPASLRAKLRGAVYFVDGDGRTIGLFLDMSTLEEVQEDLFFSSPAFAEELGKSRASGYVSAKAIERRLKL